MFIFTPVIMLRLQQFDLNSHGFLADSCMVLQFIPQVINNILCYGCVDFRATQARLLNLHK